MRKARKKPVVIEYMTFEEVWNIKQTLDNKGNNIPKIDYASIKIYWEPKKCLHIPTLEGNMTMTDKDVLIIGVRGEIYPCKIDIFHETYEVIDNE